MSGVTIDELKELAKIGGELIREKIGHHNKKVDFKQSGADLVTETDVAIENLLKETISKKHPTHVFLCEESSHSDQRLTEAPTWIIDPFTW
mmetsp:Transcript_1724/g.2028  ORF Transcript_1724/g.2028 Transcript_1724/m.2028 type:complete len:91 (+) Transcript_1724:34-306(+)